MTSLFQSTRPVWGATYADRYVCRDTAVSIHAPRVGRDSDIQQTLIVQSQFQSTRPVWGATVEEYQPAHYILVSIHAPRVGRDR
jgi:hypothetical protein